MVVKENIHKRNLFLKDAKVLLSKIFGSHETGVIGKPLPKQR